MAIKPIEEMTRPVSRRDDVLEKLRANDPDKELRAKGILPPLQKYAMSDPDPLSERNDMMETFSQKYFGKALKDLTDDQIIELEENFNDLISKTRTRTRKPEGIMQLAGGFSGDDIIQSAIMWAIETEFGSMEELERQLRTGESTIPGIIAAYQDAIVDMN